MQQSGLLGKKVCISHTEKWPHRRYIFEMIRSRFGDTEAEGAERSAYIKSQRIRICWFLFLLYTTATSPVAYDIAFSIATMLHQFLSCQKKMVAFNSCGKFR